MGRALATRRRPRGRRTHVGQVTLVDARPVYRRSYRNRANDTPVTYPALVVRQPWASLIVAGQKTIEVRRWATAYRGRLVIVAAARPATSPCGVALGVVELVDCRPMRATDEAAAIVRRTPGDVAWVVRDPSPLAPPFVRVRGRLGLFPVTVADLCPPTVAAVRGRASRRGPRRSVAAPRGSRRGPR
jgi:hypothetical protein